LTCPVSLPPSTTPHILILPVFFNQYINPIALDHLGWKYYIFYCVWLAVELAVVYFFYIETRNTPLEEIAKHFDGDKAIIGGAAATEKALQLATEAGLEDTVRMRTENVTGEKDFLAHHVERTTSAAS
jgi:hypothetical protein